MRNGDKLNKYKMPRFRIGPLLIVFVLFALPAGMTAGTFSFTGVFQYDTDVQFFSFTLAAPATGVALRTWSYAGGVNGAGQTIGSGGFEPTLNLYQSDGTQMNPGISGPCSNPLSGNPVADLLPDSITGACADVYYPTTLSFPGGLWSPGTYIVALTLFANQGIGNLSDGFFAPSILGLPVPSNFTCQVGPLGYQGTPPTAPVTDPFCDEWSPGVERTGAWALDILNVDSATQAAAVPEPGTLSFALLGAATVLAARFRTRRG